MKTHDPGDRAAIRRRALQYLTRREHYRGELQDKLTELGFEALAVAEVLGDLEGRGLLDDRRYLEQFVMSQVNRGQGPDTIARKLLMRGFESDRCAPWIEAGQDWTERAREVRRKKFGPVIPTAYAEIHVQARFLRSRGFTVTHIRAALDTESLDEMPRQESEC